MKRALVAVVVALVPATPAEAHVMISPPFVDAEVETPISFTVQNERPPHATVTIRATAPRGVAIVSAAAPPGWTATVGDGSVATWSGGRLEGTPPRTGAQESFPVRVIARGRAGTYAFRAVQTYDDGAVVRWQADLSVLPATGAAAPTQHPWGALAAAVAGVVVIVGSLVWLRRFRRSSLQER